MTATISQKIKEINVLMTIFIVALHTLTWEERMASLRIIVSTAVPMFFIISSYLYFQNYSPTWQFYKNKTISRIKSLYIPFIIYNLIYIPWILFKVNFLHLPDTRHISILSLDTITSIFIGLPETLNPVLWFVRVLIVFVITAPIIGFIVSYTKWITYPLIIINLLILHFFDYYSFFYWLPCFFLGAYLSIFEDNILPFLKSIKSNQLYYYLSIIIIVFYFIFFVFFLNNKDIDYSYQFFLYRMTVPLIIILLYTTIHYILPKKVTTFISPYTFPIYCLHIVFVNVSVQTISRIIPDQYYILTIFLSFFLAFITLLPFCKMLSKIDFLWMLLTGFRCKKNKY
jgi:hypothetical protein